MMGRRRAELRPLAALVKVVLVLPVIDWWVVGPFVDRCIVGHLSEALHSVVAPPQRSKS